MDKRKIFEDIDLQEGEILTEETLEEVTDGKGDD